MKVAIIGTMGVPACYGGFETLVENLIGDYCSKDIEYTVFCSSKDMPQKLEKYKNARLKYIYAKANGIGSLIYDSISLIKVIRGYDIILYLGAAVPITGVYKKLCQGRIILNIDGLSQFRDKYSKMQKKYLAYIKNNEIIMADHIIADNKGIQEYVDINYGKPSSLIAYGGDQVLINMSQNEQDVILNKYNLIANKYSIGVCRIEPENNCHIILEAFSKTDKTLVYIGNWDKSEYGLQLKTKYSNFPNIKMLSPIYELKALFALRNNADSYIHGHSVGGTNPSLVEAMFFGKPIICYDVIYNRATTFELAHYFKTSEDLISLLNQNLKSGDSLLKAAFNHYTWKHIVKQYEEVYQQEYAKLKQ